MQNLILVAALTTGLGCAVDLDVGVGPFGPKLSAENELLAQLRRDAVGGRKSTAGAVAAEE